MSLSVSSSLGGSIAKSAGASLSLQLGTQMAAMAGAAGLGPIMALLRKDPEHSFKFWVEIDGMACIRFKEASGMQMTTKVTGVREGGNNVHEYQMIEQQTFKPLVLKRGFYSGGTEFFAWMHNIHDPAKEHAAPAGGAAGAVAAAAGAGGATLKKSVSLVVLKYNNMECLRFNFFGAFISEYKGPKFDANGKDVAFEEITIHYDYFDVQPATMLDGLIGGAVAAGIGMMG